MVVLLTDLNKLDQKMKISDGHVPCQQLFTLSLEEERGLHVQTQTRLMNKLKLSCVIVNLKHFRQCVAYHCGIPQPERHLVAHLCAVTDFACRDLSDSLFQLCHQHFIEHQECLPEGQSTDTQSMHLSKKNQKTYIPTVQGKWSDDEVMWVYLLRVGHDEELSSFDALSSGIPSSTISFTAFRTSSTCSR